MVVAKQNSSLILEIVFRNLKTMIFGLDAAVFVSHRKGTVSKTMGNASKTMVVVGI